MAGRSNPGLKKAHQQVAYTHEQIIELDRCERDPIYFIRNYVKIKHPKRGKISFALYDYQEELVKMYMENRFNIILSARQTGKTETSCAFLLWYAIFQPEKTVLIASNKSSNAMELISKIRFAYEELPNWLKPGIDDDNWNKHTCSFDNKSRIVSTTTSKDSGRGLSISLIYCDELAFVKPHVQEEFWDSILPTISTGGSMIITSTPNGDSNLFARTWFASVARIPEERVEDDFIPLWVKWDQPPGRDAKFKHAMISKLGERKWEQEFECRFLSSDRTLFDSYYITQAEEVLKRRIENILALDPNKDHPEYVPSYPYRVSGHKFFKKLDKSATYIVGVDPATGSGDDYSVIQVFEFPSLIQVMEYRSNSMSSPVMYTQFKNIIKFLEIFTKEVYFSIENNGVGQGMLSLYENDENPPMYATMVSDSGAKRIGINTNQGKKIKAALKFKELFERGLVTVNSDMLFHEMKNYVRREGSYAANPGATDDCIAACLIIFHILEELASYDDRAYVKMYSVGAEIEMEGKWEYSDDDREGITEEYDDDETVMPFILT
ncbi:terminase large subunit [Xanthomonas phage Xoo-sp13]|nr:terminase large subunit [Xanthomonas phage Xoo-sp13]